MKIIGIINLSEDSFSSTGRFSSIENAVAYSQKLISDGCDIIDIGAESTKTKFKERSDDEQLSKIIPFIKSLKKQNKSLEISIDTRSPSVARYAVEKGCTLINTVTTGDNIDEMLEIMTKHKSDIIFTHMPVEHMKGKNMSCDNIIDFLMRFFSDIKDKFSQYELDENRLIIDPGISFGKSGDDNLSIIREIDKFVSEFKRVCIGASHKKFSSKVFKNLSSENHNIVDLTINSYVTYKGVEFIRVHDVDIMSDVSGVIKALINSR